MQADENTESLFPLSSGKARVSSLSSRSCYLSEKMLPHTRQLIQGLQGGIPVIHFATGNPALYPLLAEAGGDVIGVDWRIELDAAWAAIGEDRGIMGNLDPMTLLAPEDHIREAARDILSKAAQRAGHIFNLGHGILPQIPVQNVILLVESVKALSAR